MTFQKLLNKLPIDIIRYIIPFTYNIQNKILLNDICNYSKTKTQVFAMYYSFWTNEDNEDKAWLANDIFSYANLDKASMFGYTDNFYNLLYRNPNYKTIDIINYLEKAPVEVQINIFWGLLNSAERYEIIALFKTRNEV
jgi:hypothetical protein